MRKANEVSRIGHSDRAFGIRDGVVAFCAILVALFCWLGVYACPSADDYNFFYVISSQGFFEAQRMFYLEWTGRIFNTLLLSLTASLGAGAFYGFLPLATALLSFMAFSFCLGVLVPGLSPGDRFVKALLLQAASLSALPALNETFYWLSGMPYTWTAAFSLLALALAVRSFREAGTGMAFWGCAALLFLNGTLLEPTSAMQIGLAFLALLYFLHLGEAAKARRAAVFLSVALSAFFVMFLAPGTSARMGGMTAVAFLPRLFKTLGVAAVFGSCTIVKFFARPIVYVFLLFLPAIAQTVAPVAPRLVSRPRAWHIGLLTALIAPLMQAMVGWATGAGLPERAEGLTLWLMGAAWVLLWSFGYRQETVLDRIRASRLFRWRGMLLTLSLLLSPNFIALIGDLRVAPAYRAELEAREELVRRQRAVGRAEALVPLLTVRPKLLFFSDLRPWPSDWKNQSYAACHGVKSVMALPEALYGEERAREAFLRGDPGVLEGLAGSGDSRLQFLVGELYDTTFAEMDGVAKDNARAAEWYLKAAGLGDAHAQRRLTRLYAAGKGVSRNYFKAVYWLLRSQF